MSAPSVSARVALHCLVATLVSAPVVRADSDWLYGIHWWGEVGENTAGVMLDCPTYGGWDVETVVTHSDPWWAPSYFVGLYQELYANKNMTIITRIDYNWGETVPAPGSPGWPDAAVAAVNTLRHGSHIWIIGNEPNILGEGNNWPDNEVTPSGYATVYRDVRSAIHSFAQASPAGEHLVLIAAPSPGGVIPGVRWMDGNQWLGQVLDNIPNAEIDGLAIHSYGGSVSDFHNTYVSQLNLIDSKGLSDRPIYLTEWNKVSTEAEMAQFARDCFADLNTWNQTMGNHNIRCLCWFVYASKGWDDYSIDYWRTHGNPPGDPGDLYTAYQQTVDLRYEAGLVGTRAPAPEIGRSPSSFTHAIYKGDDLPNDTFTVQNTGGQTLNYTITDDVDWLEVDPTDGSSTGEADPITILYSTSDRPIGGPYNAIITITDPAASNDPEHVTVALTVSAWPYGPADFDRDTDVDQDDFGYLQSCMTGPRLGPPAPDCEKADLDEDDDVDQTDFGLFQRCLSGAGYPADPDCAD